MTNAELFTPLQAYLRQAFPDKTDLSISPVAPLAVGWESEIYAFDLEHGPAGERQREPLALRLYLGEGDSSKAGHEYRSLELLHRAGYPVPRLYGLETDRAVLGKPFLLMEKIEGQVMWGLIEVSSPERQLALLTQFCQLFVQLHNLDWQPFAQANGVPPDPDRFFFIDRWLQDGHATVERYAAGDFLPALRWLERRRDWLGCARPAPLHNDFHPSNVLVRADGSAAVVDWTSFSVSDPRFDLGWTLVLAHAYGAPELRNLILYTYQQVAGQRMREMEPFIVIACLRRLADIGLSLALGAEHRGMRPETADLMRQDLNPHRRIYDLLLELTGSPIPSVERLLWPENPAQAH